jgi:hypothetical protein
VNICELIAGCQKKGWKCTIRNRDGKIYATISWEQKGGVKEVPYLKIYSFVKSYIEDAYMTSFGAYSRAVFRLNPDNL